MVLLAGIYCPEGYEEVACDISRRPNYTCAVPWDLNASRISLLILTLHQALPHIEQ